MNETPKLEDIPKLRKELRRLLIYSKILTLITLSQYKEDGYPYRYLREDLEMPDGALRSNMTFLEKNGYIEKREEIVEEKPNETIYKILPKGSMALSELVNWAGTLKKYVKASGGA